MSTKKATPKNKVMYEVVRWSIKKGTQTIIINNLTEAQAKKIVSTFPKNDAYNFTARIDRKNTPFFGLKKPVTKGLTTLCAKTVGVDGRRKKDGTVKKNHVVKKGGKVVAVKKKATAKKK